MFDKGKLVNDFFTKEKFRVGHFLCVAIWPFLNTLNSFVWKKENEKEWEKISQSHSI